jgi:anti-sigma factor RsiW
VNRLRKFLRRSLGCRDIHRLLFAYAQGGLDPEVKRRLDEHLAGCPPCLDFVQTYHQTITATRCHCRCHHEMPPELRRRLEEFIETQL